MSSEHTRTCVCVLSSACPWPYCFISLEQSSSVYLLCVVRGAESLGDAAEVKTEN